MFADLLDPAHIIVLLIIVLLIFGPRRLPELGSSICKTLRMFKNAQQGVDEGSFRDVPPKNTHQLPSIKSDEGRQESAPSGTADRNL